MTLPAQENPPVTRDGPMRHIEHNGHTITLLGTAHVSQASADAVRRLIDSGAYDAVAVELCPSRHHAIVNPDALAKMDLFQVIREGKAAMVAASLALGAYQQRMADELGIRPGEEMRTAIECARAAHLPVQLIDREIGTTLKRIYRNVPWWKRLSLFSGLLGSVISKEKITEEEIEHLKEGDILESAFAQFADQAQEIYQPLVDERDRYMAARLLQEHSQAGSGNTLAVVGAGHLNGIARYLQEPGFDPASEIQRLEQEPPPGKLFKVLPWIIIALILLGFVLGFSQSSELGWQIVGDWVFINGGLSALGALIAGGHPLTVVTAFLAAPLTSLNPTIGAGLVAGAAETFLRRPSVGDFSRLRQDTARLRGWWRNRVTRVLLVFLLSSLGSGIGTYVAGFAIFDRLSG